MAINELCDSYVPEIMNLYDEKERFVCCGRFVQVKFQNNWKNFAYRVAKDQETAEKFLEEKPQILFRTLIEKMDDSILQSLGIELQEVDE